MSTNMQIEISETPDQNTIETNVESMVDDLNQAVESMVDDLNQAIAESIEVPTLLLFTIAAWAKSESHNIHKEKTYNRNMSFAFGNMGGFGEEVAMLMYPDALGSVPTFQNFSKFGKKFLKN